MKVRLFFCASWFYCAGPAAGWVFIAPLLRVVSLGFGRFEDCRASGEGEILPQRSLRNPNPFPYLTACVRRCLAQAVRSECASSSLDFGEPESSPKSHASLEESEVIGI
jgi:hypothetical protein